jgi:hypothetical protein
MTPRPDVAEGGLARRHKQPMWDENTLNASSDPATPWGGAHRSPPVPMLGWAADESITPGPVLTVTSG